MNQRDNRQIESKPKAISKTADKVDTRKRPNSLEEGNQKDNKKTSKAASSDNLKTNLSVLNQAQAASVVPTMTTIPVMTNQTTNGPQLDFQTRHKELLIARQQHRAELQFNQILKELSEPFQIPEACGHQLSQVEINTILTFNTIIDSLNNATISVIRAKIRSLVDSVHSLTIPRHLHHYVF